MIKIISAMSVHIATGNDFCPIGLICCVVTTDKLQFRHTFIVCKKLQKELATGLDMQQFHRLGWNWTNEG